MKRVYISIGSNIERYRHVSAALDALAGWFGELAISPVYESESVGFDGSDFLNLVVGVDTENQHNGHYIQGVSGTWAAF